MNWKNIVLCALILQSGIACAQYTTQTFEKRYTESLLDSALKLEFLKPIVFNLEKTNEHLNKENTVLKAKISLLRIDYEMQKQRFELLFTEQNKKNKKANLKAFIAGFLLGKTTPPY